MKTKIKDALTKGERNLANLTIGKKKTKSKEDKKHAAEIEGIKKKGGSVYIPHD